MTRQFAVVAALFFAITAPAHAALNVSTSTTQAGAPANVTLSATFATTPSSVTVHFPPGLVGNPSGPKCPQATFVANGCPANTEVGTATAHAIVLGLPTDVGGGSRLRGRGRDGQPGMGGRGDGEEEDCEEGELAFHPPKAK